MMDSFSKTVYMSKEWTVSLIVDSDDHLNIYIENENEADIFEIESGQGDGDGEQLALRFTTAKIEKKYKE